MNKSDTKNKKVKIGTKTSAFGTPGRISHDSSEFYGSRLYEGKKPIKVSEYNEEPISEQIANRIYCKSSEQMDDIPNNSIHLMITSPPYNVKKEYDQDLSLLEYRQLLYRVFSQVYSKLVTGGRACVNVANLGRKPYIPLHSMIIDLMADIGYLMRGEIIWNKGATASPSTAWGSWMSASNPVLRDVHEYILVFSKDTFSRKRENRVNSIAKEQFLEWTKSVWTFPAISARSVGHPAPFPEELPNRLIQLYSFVDDVVLDPFCGSGTTCLAAKKAARRFIGYDIDQSYVDLANKRLSTVDQNVQEEKGFSKNI